MTTPAPKRLPSLYRRVGKEGVIYAAALLFCMGQGLLLLGIVFLAKTTLGSQPSTVGWLVGLNSLVFVLGCLLVRPAVTARLSPLHQLMIATFGSTVISVLLMCVRTIGAAFVLFPLVGLAVMLFWPTIAGWLSTGKEGPALARTLAWYNVAWCTGAILSPFICGWLSEGWTRAPFLAAASICLLTAAIVVGASRYLPSEALPPPPAPAQTLPCHASGGTLYRYPYWVGVLVTFLGMNVILTVFPMAALDQLHLSKTAIGGILLVRALFNTMSFMALGRVSFWHFRAWPMLAGQALGCVVFLSLPGIQSFWGLAGLFALFGLSGAISYTGSAFHGVSGSTDRARRMAIHEVLISSGFIIGSVGGSTLYQAASMARVYRSCAGLMALAIVVQAGLCVWIRRRENAATVSDIYP
ncbi:MAG: MFS transporter [Kiritimatiellaeota bacterium]|nr:MFS transporter [Kiritimatiellota bacterium]